jgi:hypothetical protein
MSRGCDVDHFAGIIDCHVAGLGAGPIFGATVGNALKWFPDRRGLATGPTAAAFGAGAVLTVAPLASVIQASGCEAAFGVNSAYQINGVPWTG